MKKSNRHLKRGKSSGESFDTVRYQGTFRRLRSGAGIVRVAAEGPKRPAMEIFVSRSEGKDAASGDAVLVETDGTPRRRRSDGESKLRGRIVEVLRRDTNRFVGVFFTESGHGYVRVDGDLFKCPIQIGDASAVRAVSGDKVVLELTRFPSHFQRGEGVIVETLGRRGTPGLDTKMILREYDLPERFSDSTLREARDRVYEFEKIARLADSSSEANADGRGRLESELSGRVDLRDETIFTIDPQTARDFDDAVSLTRFSAESKNRAARRWRLGVHIADVSHFVASGSHLDTEARRRGTSVYLIDTVVPMLPETLSNSIASLQPGELRLTKSVFLDFSASGTLLNVEVVRSFIQSRQRLSYEEADAFLANPTAEKKRFDPQVGTSLKNMARLAEVLRQKRLEHGAIELNFSELEIVLDETGSVAGAVREEQTAARRLIEEFMLAANRAVAEYLTRCGASFLRRIHPPPTLEKLDAFALFIKSLGLENVDRTAFAGDRFALAALLESVAGRQEEEAVHYALLRAMPKAVYSPDSEGHFALAAKDYCHFTSPIRRYPDLTVHRLLDRLLDGKKPRLSSADLTRLGQQCSAAEQRAEKAERELKKLKLINFMSRHIGKTMIGTVTGVERFGFFVRGGEIPAEGLVSIDTLTDDYYHFDRDERTLTGFKKGNIIKMGDQVVVEIRRADPDARRLDFLLTDTVSPTVSKRKSSPSPAKVSPKKRSAKRMTKKSARSKSPKKNQGR